MDTMETTKQFEERLTPQVDRLGRIRWLSRLARMSDPLVALTTNGETYTEERLP